MMADFTEEPGNDSGCTAVIALIAGTKLLVANAGDSRFETLIKVEYEFNCIISCST